MTDDQLPADARQLLAAGRDRMGPDAATVARLRARVEAAVIVGASATAASAMAAPVTTAAPATAAATATTASASVAVKTLAVKLVLVAVGTSAVGTTAYVAHKVATREDSAEVAAPPLVMPSTTTDDEVAELQPPVALAAPELAPIVVAPVEEPPPPLAIEPAPATEAASAAPHATLAREIELVDRATIALRTGALDAALAALNAYSTETAGGGQLAQDADALHIEVLCRTHSADARAELAAFDRRWPHSAQRSHLSTVCTEASK